MRELPSSSVVITCLDGADQLGECVRSVVEQQVNCEIIIVDHGSSDDSLARAHALLDKAAVHMTILSQKNRGPAAARNAGLRLAQGKYVCFLDAGDRHAPGFLGSASAVLDKDSGTVAVFCGIQLMNGDRHIEPWQHESLERTQPGNLLMRTEVVRQFGGFPEQQAFRGRAGGEDGTFRSELKRHGKIFKIDKPLFRHRWRQGGHFDYFLERATMQDGRIQFRTTSPEEDDGSLKNAIRDYRDEVQERILGRTLETLRSSATAGFEFHRLASRLEKVEGYLHPGEGYVLYSLARNWPVAGMTVEIGSFKGRSTCWLASGCREGRGAKVVAVDHFRGSPEHQSNGAFADKEVVEIGSTLPTFRRNLEEQKLSDWVTVRVGSSAEASQDWKEPIRLLFIDGEHSDAAVRHDFASWSRFVVPGGAVAFHDVGVFPGVTRFYGELCAAGSGWKEVGRYQSLGILQRVGKESSPPRKLESEAAELRKTLQTNPQQVDAMLRLAQVLEQKKELSEAMATYRQILQVQPAHADAHNFLGILLAKDQQFEEAVEHFSTFNKLQPNRAAGHHNIAVAHVDQDKVAESLPHFDMAIRLDPEHAEAHKGKGMAYLKLGQFAEGWPEYEWRWRCKDLAPLRTPRSLWDGSPLEGRTILLHSEQGLGDTIQFVRYAGMVKERGGRVVLAGQAPLLPLLRTLAGVDRVVSQKSGLPPHDVHLPLLSLPRVLGTALSNVPAEVPYLHPEPGRVRFWRSELGKEAGFKVGIVWQGNTRHLNDVNRSIPLERFQVLSEVPGVRFFSLQVGKESEQLQKLAGRFAVTDLRQRIEGAFAETAAAMKNLDLVICCDTSVAHLAGALGVPVWVALPFAADWRWLQHREDNPWYPTMRLFRQIQPRDWPEVFARIKEALQIEIGKPRPAATESVPQNGYVYNELPENSEAESDRQAAYTTYAPLHANANGSRESSFDIVSQPSFRKVSPHMLDAQKLMHLQRFAQAEETLRLVVGGDPSDAEGWFLLGQAQHSQNRLGDAVASFRKLLEVYPDHAEGQAMLGILACKMGKRQEGEVCLREAIRLQPTIAKAHNNLGVLLAEQGKKNEALACWQETVKLDPNYPEGHFNLALGLSENKQPVDSIKHYERALQLRPDYAEAYSNLALLHIEQGRPADAIVLLEHALRLKPDFVDAHNNLGLAHADLGRGEEALDCYRQALKRQPKYSEVYNNYGTALAAQGRDDEALACFAHALRLRPNYPEAHWHQALTWLHQGDLVRGWPEYEWRWKRKRARPRRFKEPLWDGSNLEGKTILLWCEQGLGDSLQFIRYARMVKARGGNVVVECPPKLMNILFTCAGIDQFVPQEQQLPPFDVQVPLLTLPGIFGTRLHSIPADVPYLSADDRRVSHWREELAGDAEGTKLRIGIAWQGNPKHRWDRHRSFALDYFQAIAGIKGVRLYSVQKGAPAEDVDYFSRRFGLVDLSSRLEDFTDTAAVMRNLDLVITCDSAPAHLAGALGVPVWVPLSAMSDWRWLKEREDSPWYPTLRLFRQRQLGDWHSVFDRITEEVKTLVKEKS